MTDKNMEMVFKAIKEKGIIFGDEFKSEIFDMLTDISSMHFPNEKDRKDNIEAVFDAIAKKNVVFSDEFKNEVFTMLMTVGKGFRGRIYFECTTCENFKEKESFACFECDNRFSQRRSANPL